MQTPEEVVVELAEKNLIAAEKKLAAEVLNDVAFEATLNEIKKARAAINLVKH